jgi:hypothetical protein
MAFLKLTKSKGLQETLLKYGVRPAIAGITMPDYMPLNIPVGDSPRNRSDLEKLWEIVGSTPSVKDAKMNIF